MGFILSSERTQRSTSLDHNMLDIRKNEIKPDARVAYNRSGYMASGVVKSIQKRFRLRSMPCYQQDYGYLTRAIYTIRILNDQDGTISKVKDPRSVLVIL